MSWKLGEDKLQLDVTVPAGTEADVIVPTERFEAAAIQLDGRKAGPVVHVTAGEHRIEVTGRFTHLPSPNS
jgi:hypothetical protein